MTVMEKLCILGDAAKYDASCSSSGVERPGSGRNVGSAAAAGICHSWSADGRCISLLKVLLSNECSYQCAYCVNAADRDVPRASFEPDELAELTLAFYRRNYIEGLFLSSAVRGTPDRTMERMIDVLARLRRSDFGGYIHMKAIPGASPELLSRAGRLADRMSVNIELPSRHSLGLLAPQKSADAILSPMGQLAASIRENAEERRQYPHAPTFAAAGQSTQLIVGASPEDDRQILSLSQELYRRYALRRVYYSAYIPVSSHPALARITRPPLLREHRLYQADWLLRFYGFEAGELLDTSAPMLDEQLDPKCGWALRHPEFFPVEINRAPLYTLLRVPGIGGVSARRIIAARRYGSLTFEDLKKLGVVLRRAAFFVTCGGRTMPELRMNARTMRQALLRDARPDLGPLCRQLSLFDPVDTRPSAGLIEEG
ncbi:MAG: putative DNA modification/repair radical SAM protein [Clostridiales bacterium]|nr:putative DNA modification/repair radical SAM protein [Clostridiales bacterium]